MTVDEIFTTVQEKLPKNTPARGVVQAINEIVEDIQGEGPWTFWQKKADLTLIAEYNTGTVSVTQGGTTVTGVGTTFTSGMAGRKFQSATSEVYTIATFTDTTHVELDTAWVSDTISGETFSIYQDTYVLPDDTLRAIAFWDETIQRVVEFLPPTTIKTLDVLFNTTGLLGKLVGQWGYNSSNKPQVVFFPRPTTAAKIPIYYYKRPTAVSGPAGTPDMPEHMHNTIARGLVAHYTRDSDDFVNFQRSLKQRKKEDDAILANVPVVFSAAPALYAHAYTQSHRFEGVQALTRHSRVTGI